MEKQYILHKTANHLLTIEDHAQKHRTEEHNSKILDKAQRAYLQLREEYGMNYPIGMSELCRTMKVSRSTCNENFCGGIMGVISQSEQIVLNRFTEAARGRELRDVLSSGFLALIRPRLISKYNSSRQKNIDMRLRTEFCAKSFGIAYWRLLVDSIRPSIDAFLSEKMPVWNKAKESEKDFAFLLLRRRSSNWRHCSWKRI